MNHAETHQKDAAEKEEQSDSGFNSNPQSEGSSNDGSRSISGIDDLDDEIPF